MTSSLVGSEMCIRDRASPEQRGGGRGLSSCFALGLEGDLRPQYSQEPVSYTHLTLPTICSV
eukprot:11969449-Prorocentrum_lima.AAC.1